METNIPRKRIKIESVAMMFRCQPEFKSDLGKAVILSGLSAAEIIRIGTIKEVKRILK